MTDYTSFKIDEAEVAKIAWWATLTKEQRLEVKREHQKSKTLTTGENNDTNTLLTK